MCFYLFDQVENGPFTVSVELRQEESQD